ncbi:MAG TPA: hypothetical protein O0X25_04060 [Methanocorpusculum sp.]|nr:hypothetical protein [Methanocorpusculum sp.]HJJ49773.1 hypothetical protein [Methanocorpusculum sp.]HJJ57389.1 hypothetical protein [Methanocorpusculum sp.]
MPDTTQELKIFGTEIGETAVNSLVFNDTKLQSLDRRVGQAKLFFDRELFQESLASWEGIPVIYHPSGVHPSDFAGVCQNPGKAAADIGGKFVGHVARPRIVLEGGARLMASLVIESDESEISALWSSGKLVPSTAFTVTSDGDRITSAPVPNHVLIFPYVVDRVLPGDPGAYVNSVLPEVLPMPEEIHDGTEDVPQENPAAAEAAALQEEIAGLRHALSEKETLAAEAENLKHSAEEEIAALKAEVAQFKAREQQAKFERLLQSLPIGMKETEEQIAQLKTSFETDPVTLLMHALEMKNTEKTTEPEGVPFAHSISIDDPYTTVGDLSRRSV